MATRTHIVMVPGFGGFDALGQLHYYAGVTSVFDEWRRAASPAGEAVELHYFENLPTAAVETRARDLEEYLVRLVFRRVLQPDDTVVLVGHSTGGLDIRCLLSRLQRHETMEPPSSDPTPDERPLRIDPTDVLRDARLPTAPVRRPVPSPRDCFVTSIDVRALGMAVVALGGGRTRPGDAVDQRVGLADVVALGSRVQPGEPLAWVHAADAAGATVAVARVLEAITLDHHSPAPSPLIVETIDAP
jgi:hypothetical protein